MKNIAYIFPGQGSQKVGMGKDLFDNYEEAREVYKEANEVLGFDLARLCFEGPKEELDKTENTQPAILATSVAALRVLDKERKIEPSFVAGHSLGEYTALICAGVLKFADALRLVRLRGRFMQEAVGEGEGAMAAVLGFDSEKIWDLCKDACTADEVVVPANINSPVQVVISGHKGAVERAGVAAREAGAKRVITLPVSVPSHSPLMKSAAEKLAEELKKIELDDFKVALVSNVEAAPVNVKGSVPDLLVRQLTSPVRWVEIVRGLKEDGNIQVTVEIGPGKVLTNLINRIDGQLVTINIDNTEDLIRAKNYLKKGRSSPVDFGV
ncbi:Malonyl CoA-acyl carrier protein transacylase [hydrothermal vent metagenome]|uniref:[acyl-carrier-protein] S-malonyltransferase n=1 Tax=hydrothermal vent metagenome TaxID=652676 RepID=A0A3B0VZP6_9ZZZZ